MKSWRAFLALCAASLACHAVVAWRLFFIFRTDFGGIDGLVLIGASACCFVTSTGIAVLIPSIWPAHRIAASILAVVVAGLSLYTAALLVGANKMVGEAAKFSDSLWVIVTVGAPLFAGLAGSIGATANRTTSESLTTRDVFEFVATTLHNGETNIAEIRVHNGEIITSQRTLAAACGVPVSTLNRQLAQLRKAGVLKVATAGGISRISLEG